MSPSWPSDRLLRTRTHLERGSNNRALFGAAAGGQVQLKTERANTTPRLARRIAVNCALGSQLRVSSQRPWRLRPTLQQVEWRGPDPHAIRAYEGQRSSTSTDAAGGVRAKCIHPGDLRLDLSRELAVMTPGP